jgi:hypothetical protein
MADNTAGQVPMNREMLAIDSAISTAKAGATEMEVMSSKIESSDVAYAHRRAELLRRVGVRAVPVVIGETIDMEAEAEARRTAVATLQNGHNQGWEAALAATCYPARKLPQPVADQFLHQLRIGLAAALFHHLADKKAE